MILALCHAIAAAKRSRSIRLWVMFFVNLMYTGFVFWVGTVYGGAR